MKKEIIKIVVGITLYVIVFISYELKIISLAVYEISSYVTMPTISWQVGKLLRKRKDK